MNKNECVNCCTPVNSVTKVIELVFTDSDLGGVSGTGHLHNLSCTSALNFIYKVSGKELPTSSWTSDGDGDGSLEIHLGLCPTCWIVVSQLYRLHEKLTALTNLNSIVNKTFQVIHDTDDLRFEMPESIKLENPDDLQELGDDDDDSSCPNEVQASNLENYCEDTEEIKIKCEPEAMITAESVPNNTPFTFENESMMTSQSQANVTSVVSGQSLEHAKSADLPQDPLSVAVAPSNSAYNQSKHMTDKFHRYSGNCSEPNCSHAFKSVTSWDVRQHFLEIHGQERVVFLGECHLCGGTLVSGSAEQKHFNQHINNRNPSFLPVDISLDSILRDYHKFNKSILRTKSGIRLTHDNLITVTGNIFGVESRWLNCKFVFARGYCYIIQ